MTLVRAAILGQGRSGRDIHGATLNKMKDLYQVVAVVDGLEERRKRAEVEWGCTAYSDYRALLKRDDIDLVVNALPSFLHVPISLELLSHGFHVLCEKPLARQTSEVDLLMKRAKDAGRTIAVFQQSRFSPAFVQLRKVLDSGVLGRVIQFSVSYSGFSRRWDWQTLKAMHGGNLLNTGPHPVDQALQIFGTDMMPEVLCRMDSVNSYGDAEDYVKLLLYGEGRPTVDVEISSCSAYPLFTYQVQGTRGGLTGSTTHLSWRYFVSEEAGHHQVIDTPLSKENGTPAYCQEELGWREEHWDIDETEGKHLFDTMSQAYYRMLHQTLVDGSPLQVTIEEVRQQIAVMEKCFEQNPRFAL